MKPSIKLYDVQDIEGLSWAEALMEEGLVDQESLPALTGELLQLYAWNSWFQLQRQVPCVLLSEMHNSSLTCSITKKIFH